MWQQNTVIYHNYGEDAEGMLDTHNECILTSIENKKLPTINSTRSYLQLQIEWQREP